MGLREEVLEISSEVEKRLRERGVDPRRLLEGWRGREILEQLALDDVRHLLVDPKLMEETIRQLVKEIEAHDVTGLFRIVGEAGSGKTQLAFFTIRELLEKRKIPARYLGISLQTKLPDDLLSFFNKVEDRSVVFLDEIDSVLGTLENDEVVGKFIDTLANILVSYTDRRLEGKRVAAVLLLNKRSEELLEEVAWRLRFTRRVRMPEEYENLRFEKTPELAKKVLALIRIAKPELLPEDNLSALLEMLVDWSVAYRAAVKGAGSLGVYRMRFLELYELMLNDFERPFSPLSKEDEGRKLESIIRNFLGRYLPSIRFEKDGERYIASIEKFEVSRKGPDIRYNVYVGTYATGRSVGSVVAEVKCAQLSSLRNVVGQLVGYAKESPLLIVWIYKGEEEGIEDVCQDISRRAGGAPVDYVSVPYELIRPAAYVRNSEKLLLELELKEDLEQKLRHALAYIVRKQTFKGRVEVKWEEKVKEISRELTHRLKPDKDMKTLRVGNVAKILDSILEDHGISTEKASESIVKKVLVELTNAGFLEKGTERTFKVRLNAWKARGEEAPEIVAKALSKELQPVGSEKRGGLAYSLPSFFQGSE